MSKNTERILLFSILLLTISIRLAFLTQKNLWFDEVFSWHLSLDSFYTIIVRTSADIHPPLYYFILKIWSFIFGDSVFSMRLLSTIFTSAAVFFIYPLCKRVMSPLNALMVLVLYAVSPLNLYYSQEARMSAMNLFLNIGSAYFLLLLIDSLKVKSGYLKQYLQDKIFYLYIIFTSAALYTHYFSFFLLAAQIIYLIIIFRADFKQYKPFILAYNFILAIYLLWLPTLYAHLFKGQSWRSPQTTSQVLNEYVNYIKDLNLGLYYHYTNLRLVKYITIFYGLVILLALTGLFIKKIKENDKTIILVALLAFVPLVLAGIISFKQKVEFYRYLSIIVPYILILVVYGLTKWDKKYITYPIIGSIVLINIFGINLHYSFKFKNDDYRPLVSQINAEYKPGDRIYAVPHYYGWLIDYYANHPVDKKLDDLKIPNTVNIKYGWNEVLDSIVVQRPERFWMVFDYSAVDTSKYSAYLEVLNKNFNRDFYMAYYTAPVRIDLYRFSQKK
jgi:mannosyltransferase